MKTKDRYGVLAKSTELMNRHMQVCCNANTDIVFGEPTTNMCSCDGRGREQLQQMYHTCEKEMVTLIQEACDSGISVYDLITLLRDSIFAFAALGKRHMLLKKKLGIKSTVSDATAMREAICRDVPHEDLEYELEIILSSDEFDFAEPTATQLVDRIYTDSEDYDGLVGVLMSMYFQDFLSKTERNMRVPSNYYNSSTLAGFITSPEWSEDVMEEHFVVPRIRFIALAEDVDTINGVSELMGIIHAMNGLLPKVTSKKVRQVKHDGAKEGFFMNSQQAYGYLKSPQDKHKLVIDPYAARIVEQIFRDFASGKSGRAIADSLNTSKPKVDSPRFYHYRMKDKVNPYPEQKNRWNSGTVMQILRKEVYLGHMVSGKREVANIKTNKFRKRDESEWIVVLNTHEPIITQVLNHLTATVSMG